MHFVPYFVFTTSNTWPFFQTHTYNINMSPSSVPLPALTVLSEWCVAHYIEESSHISKASATSSPVQPTRCAWVIADQACTPSHVEGLCFDVNMALWSFDGSFSSACGREIRAQSWKVINVGRNPVITASGWFRRLLNVRNYLTHIGVTVGT